MDGFLICLDNALRTLGGASRARRPCPAAPTPQGIKLGDGDRRLSGALMRVNHVGEVCAQAMYSAQSLIARDAAVKRQFDAAAREESDHLAWVEKRLNELGARTSLLNPLWYAGAFAIGLLAGAAGDRNNLGFVAETERQVGEHLGGHLERLPTSDHASRAIVAQMQIDEAAHAAQAVSAGGASLPAPIPQAMRFVACIMTRTSHYI